MVKSESFLYISILIKLILMERQPVAAIDMVPVADVYVWTPSGVEVWSGNVGARKAQLNGTTITRYSQPQAIRYATQKGRFVASSGLWYQTRLRLEKEMPEVESDFVTGEAEDTSTVLVFLKTGEKYADGLFVQYPVPNAGGTDSERDEKGIPKARQIFQMALPVRNSNVKDMPIELDPFLNTIYGMEDARKRLPDFAYVWVIPEGERRVLRSAWSWPHREDRRVIVRGYWAPADRFSDVGFREFEGGEDSITAVDERRRKLIVEDNKA